MLNVAHASMKPRCVATDSTLTLGLKYFGDLASMKPQRVATDTGMSSGRFNEADNCSMCLSASPIIQCFNEAARVAADNRYVEEVWTDMRPLQ